MLDPPAGTKVEVVASGLTIPWSIVFLPDGRMWITERTGTVREVSGGVLNPSPIFTVPDVSAIGEGGLMGMCLHPSFSGNSYVYLDYTDSPTNEKIVRYTYSGGTFTSPTVMLNGITAASFHDGGRIRFGPDGKLYISTGDGGTAANAQSLSSLNGKILRVNDDGTIPADNPFASTAGARGEIWTLGHRNPQGFDWDPNTGVMWESEHGPSGFDGPEGYDEINAIVKGSNYGWPTVVGSTPTAGMTPPAKLYVDPVAPSGLSFYNADLMPQFKGHFFVGCLRGSCMLNLAPSGSAIASDSKMLSLYGRLRAITVGPEGAIYFSTSNEDGRGTPQPGDDKVYRLIPG